MHLSGKGENLRLRFDSSESERTLPTATARRVRSEATNNPSPTTIFKLYLQFELPLVGFPSGQREQTVNLPSSTSKVRILPPPPSLPSRILSPLSTVSHISPYGKDEKLRLRFDSSESEKALPQATTRRAKRAALSHPSPTTITSVAYLIPVKHSVSYLSVREG